MHSAWVNSLISISCQPHRVKTTMSHQLLRVKILRSSQLLRVKILRSSQLLRVKILRSSQLHRVKILSSPQLLRVKIWMFHQLHCIRVLQCLDEWLMWGGCSITAWRNCWWEAFAVHKINCSFEVLHSFNVIATSDLWLFIHASSLLPSTPHPHSPTYISKKPWVDGKPNKINMLPGGQRHSTGHSASTPSAQNVEHEQMSTVLRIRGHQ